MNKRTFLKISSLLAATPVLGAFRNMVFQEKLSNWAGNLEYSTTDIHYPRNVNEIRQLMITFDKVKALGSRHCFNAIADSSHHLISMRELNTVVTLDKAASTVTIEGGMNYGQLCPFLHEHGFALPNLASLPHISVAGACITATHGSGIKNGNLATVIRAMEFITAQGEVVSLSEPDGENFYGAVVNLGAIGFITRLTLALQPAFDMRQYVFEELPLKQLQDNFDRIVSAGYSVSLFTDWQKESINEVWIKCLAEQNGAAGNKEFFGSRAARRNVHPIIDLSAENCTEQMGVVGPWYERLPHFRMGFTPSSGKELQAEYFVPRTNAVDAFMAVQKMGKEIGPHLFISEIRTIAADDLWLSPAYKQDSVAIHFTWKQDWAAVSKLLPRIEKELAPYNVKPHWGKLFTVPPAVLASRYSRFADFKKLVSEYDPKGKFINDFLAKQVF